SRGRGPSRGGAGRGRRRRSRRDGTTRSGSTVVSSGPSVPPLRQGASALVSCRGSFAGGGASVRSAVAELSHGLPTAFSALPHRLLKRGWFSRRTPKATKGPHDPN